MYYRTKVNEIHTCFTFLSISVRPGFETEAKCKIKPPSTILHLVSGKSSMHLKNKKGLKISVVLKHVYLGLFKHVRILFFDNTQFMD